MRGLDALLEHDVGVLVLLRANLSLDQCNDIILILVHNVVEVRPTAVFELVSGHRHDFGYLEEDVIWHHVSPGFVLDSGDVVAEL